MNSIEIIGKIRDYQLDTSIFLKSTVFHILWDEVEKLGE